MELGNTVFFIFRGRAYGIPPLAWRRGEAILAEWQKALAVGEVVEPAKRKEYFRAIRQLTKLLWKECRPTGPVRRLLRFFHLHRNPFRKATEGEIGQLAVFMLGRRTMSHERAPMTQTVPEPGT
jgi:ribosomal protein S14